MLIGNQSPRLLRKRTEAGGVTWEVESAAPGMKQLNTAGVVAITKHGEISNLVKRAVWGDQLQEGVTDSDTDDNGTSVDDTASEQHQLENYGESSSYSTLSRYDSGLIASDRGQNTDMDEDGSTVNGSESVLNSSVNSAFSGFQSLLRKQMGGDEPQPHRNDNRPESNDDYNAHPRPRSPTLKGQYDRNDSGYHGNDYEKRKQNYTNGDSSEPERYSSRNGHDKGRYSRNQSPSRSTQEEVNQQGSLSSEQELGRYFDGQEYDRSNSYDRSRRSLERLPKHSSDRTAEYGRAQSAERVSKTGGSYQRYNNKNNSADSVSENTHSRHDLPPPRGRSASPYRFTRFRDTSQDEDNPYKELDPRFRNSSPGRSAGSTRDKSSSPHREMRSYSRDYHSLPPNVPASPSSDHHQREHMDYPHSLDGVSGNGVQSQPPVRQPLVTARTTPVSASARLPVNRALFVNGNAENGHREDTLKLQDLEDTVTTLKRLLRDREHEVDDLKASQRRLHSELHTVRSHSPTPAASDSPPRCQSPSGRTTDYEKKCDELIKEKEILATEVWKLKKQLTESTRSSNGGDYTQNPMDSQSGLDNYDPNNQHALQRKISELESQIQDLQEANESADGKLSHAENKIKHFEKQLKNCKAEVDSLYEENKQLRRSDANPSDVQELEEENSRLRTEIATLRKDMFSPGASDSAYLRQEIRKLREDLRELRDANHTLTQDNIKLTEYIRDVEGTGPGSKLNGHERLIEPKQAKQSLAVYDKEGLSVSNITFDEDEFLLCPSSVKNDSETNNTGSSFYQTSTYSSFRSSSAASSSHGLDSGSHLSSIRDRSTPIFSPERSRDYLRPTAREPSPNRTLTNGASDASVVSDLNSSNCSRTSQYSLIEDITDEHLSLPVANGEQSNQRSGHKLNGLDTRGSGCVSQSPIGEKNPSSSYGSIKFQPQVTPLSKVKETISETRTITVQSVSAQKSSLKPLASSTPPDIDQNDQTLVNSIALLEVDETVKQDLLKNLNLTNIQPTVSVEGVAPTSKKSTRKRSGSLDSQGSGSTDSILNEAEEQIRMTTSGLDMMEFGLSTDTLVDAGREAPLPSRVPRSSSPTLTASINLVDLPSQTQPGTRPFNPKPQRTQHNKAALGPPSKDTSFSIGSRRPFVPHSCTEIQIGDVVKFSRLGGKISRGMVKYSGHLPGKNDMYLGLELENEIGKHDGIYDGTRYFTCKHNRGVFVAFSKVVMAWSG